MSWPRWARKASSSPAKLGLCGLTCCEGWNAVVPAGHRAHEVSVLLANCGAEDVNPFLTHRELQVLMEKFVHPIPIVEVNLEIDVGALVGRLSHGRFALQKRDACVHVSEAKFRLNAVRPMTQTSSRVASLQTCLWGQRMEAACFGRKLRLTLLQCWSLAVRELLRSASQGLALE